MSTSEAEPSYAWYESLLAALPHLFYGTIVILPIVTGGTLSLGGVWRLPALIFFATLAIAVIFILERPWPRWAGSWLGYGMVVVLRLPLYTSDTVQLSDLALLALVGWFLLVVLVSLWLAGRDSLSGVLAILALLPMLWARLALADVTPSVQMPLWIGISLLTALSAALVLRQERRWSGVWLGLGLNLVVSLLVTYAITVRSPSPALLARLPGTPLAVIALTSFIVQAAVSVVAVTAPVWAWGLWDRIRGRPSGAPSSDQDLS